MNRLAGKTCVVTGGAAGQGRGVAERFAAEGARVAVLDVDQAAGESVVAAMHAAGRDARFIRTDVSSVDDWAAAIDDIVEAFGGIDVLYNNAAVFLHDDRSIMETSADTWNRVMAVNVDGVFLGCKFCVPSMIGRGGGSIVNVASIRAWYGTSSPQNAYAASKGAVVALTKSLAIELATHSIRVNVICPGTIETAMAPLQDPKSKAQRLGRYPLGRFGTVDDVTGAAVYFASDDSPWTTGTVLPIDGGTSVFYI